MPVVQSLPAGQSRQRGESSREYYPAGQVTMVDVRYMSGQADPAVQAVHDMALPTE